jgi:hypothetical protein
MRIDKKIFFIRLVNLCDDIKISFHTDQNDSYELESCQSMFFIWPNLIQSKPRLFWGFEASIDKEYHPVQDAISGTEYFSIKFPTNLDHTPSDEINFTGGNYMLYSDKTF